MGRGDRPKHRPPPRGIPEVAPVGRPRHARDRRGKFAPAERVEDARVVALTQRTSALGIKGDREGRRAVMGVHLGEPLGLVLERLCLDRHGVVDRAEVASLWAIWLGYTGAERTYRARILSRPLGPQASAFAGVSERVEADPDHREDLRTDDEKDEGARESHRRWMDRLDRLPTGFPHRSRLVQAESGMGPSLWEGRAPTSTGRAVLLALRALRDVIEGER